MRSFITLMACSAMFLLLITAPAHSTQLIPRTPGELGDESALVVRGSVQEVRSFWSPNRTKILTEVIVRVDEDFKGSAPSQVRIVQLGGVVDGVRVTVSGALHWKTKEEVLLFLKPYTAGAYQVSGFSQGKFAIERDAKTGEAYVSRRALEGIEWAQINSSKTSASEGVIQKMSLHRFLDEALGER